MKQNRKKNRVAGTIFLILLIMIVVSPFYVMVVGTFKPTIELIKTPIDLKPFTKFTLKNINTVLQKSDVFLWLKNSLVISLTVAFSTVFIGVSAGYAFAKIQFRGKVLFFSLVIATMLMPKQMLMIPNYLVARSLHLQNSLIGVILTSISPAFGVFLSRQQISSLPEELFDAAEIDGCGELKKFFSVMLPITLPTVGTIAILSFFATFNDYVWQSIMISNKNIRTLPIGLSYFTQLQVNNRGAQLAMSFIATLPLIILFILCQNFFIKGATSGAVKG